MNKMNKRCGCKKEKDPVKTTKDVVGTLIINKKKKAFGANDELNGVTWALYIFIFIALIISIILSFFNIKAYF